MILALALLGGLGLVLAVRTSAGLDESLTFPAAFGCDAALTILILFPAVYALVRGTRPTAGATARHYAIVRVIVILLLIILAPIAACIVFVTICVASLAVSAK